MLISDIAITTNHRVLVATTTDGIYELIGEKLVPLWRTKNSRLPSNRIEMMTVSPDGTLFIGTTKGLCEVKNGRWKVFSYLENVKDVQQMGAVWYASALSTEGAKL